MDAHVLFSILPVTLYVIGMFFSLVIIIMSEADSEQMTFGLGRRLWYVVLWPHFFYVLITLLIDERRNR